MKKSGQGGRRVTMKISTAPALLQQRNCLTEKSDKEKRKTQGLLLNAGHKSMGGRP